MDMANIVGIESLLSGMVFGFLLVFARIGTAVMVMPGIGDSFVPAQIRLLTALALCAVLFPVLHPTMPAPPTTQAVFVLIIMEGVIGAFFGTIARILIAALDTAGMLVSMASGLGNAQIFNPGFAMQGSLMGAFFSVTGVTILFVTELHHFLIYGLVSSYEMFPVGGLPDSGGMAETVARAVSASFLVGVQIAVPFLVVSLLVYTGMGVLSRLMPQVQVFLLALPLQIMLSLLALMLVVPSLFLFWLGRYEQGLSVFFTGG